MGMTCQKLHTNSINPKDLKIRFGKHPTYLIFNKVLNMKQLMKSHQFNVGNVLEVLWI